MEGPLGPTLAFLGPRPGSIPMKLQLQRVTSDGSARNAKSLLPRLVSRSPALSPRSSSGLLRNADASHDTV